MSRIRILSVTNFVLGVAYCFVFLPKLSMRSNFAFYFLFSFMALLLNHLRNKKKEGSKLNWKEILIGPLTFSVTAISTLLIAYILIPSIRNASFSQIPARVTVIISSIYVFYFHYLNFKKLG